MLNQREYFKPCVFKKQVRRNNNSGNIQSFTTHVSFCTQPPPPSSHLSTRGLKMYAVESWMYDLSVPWDSWCWLDSSDGSSNCRIPSCLQGSRSIAGSVTLSLFLSHTLSIRGTQIKLNKVMAKIQTRVTNFLWTFFPASLTLLAEQVPSGRERTGIWKEMPLLFW